MVNPIASWDGGFVFDASGAVATTLELQPDGSLQADFESLTASINRQDGVFLVFLVTLDALVVPGEEYTLSAADVLPFEDPELDPILIEFRPGRLRIRAATDPYAFGVAQLDVQPGSGGVLELDTKEPFPIGSASVVLHYDASVLLPGSLPTVTADPRHGVAALAVDAATPGTITIGLVSSPGAGEKHLNEEVPGELLRVTIPTRPDAPPGHPVHGHLRRRHPALPAGQRHADPAPRGERRHVLHRRPQHLPRQLRDRRHRLVVAGRPRPLTPRARSAQPGERGVRTATRGTGW